MSLTTNRPLTNDPLTSDPLANGPAGFTDSELAHLAEWADLHGLELAVKPSGPNLASRMALVGYETGVASWTIFRAGHQLWLDLIENRSGQGCEGSQVMVESIEDATARIIDDTET